MTVTKERAVEDLVPTGRLPYMPGIDGLRAIAVMAVLFYHADFTWARGGFLGVEVFFVISGYLITSLLLVEWLRTGTIDVKSFWLRRARRLLPAVVLLLIGVSIAALLVYRDALARLPGDIAAAMTYVTNWYLVINETSYFESFGRPPLLQHLWSLSVEEQFYVLWPLIFTLGIALFKGRGTQQTIRSFFAMTVAGIIASTLLMAFLHTPFDDPSRVYYGTDTRAAGILVGVALSLVWIPWRLSPSLSSRRTLTLNAVGLAAMAGLIGILAMMDEFSTFLYRGGFLVTSLLTATVIATTVHPAGVLGRILENPVAKWIGTRSYAIYLWHWPVFMVLRPGIDVADRPIVAFAVRLAITFAISEVSYRYVESPIRHKGFRQWVVDLRRAAGVRTARGGSAIAVTTLAFLVVLTGGLLWGSVVADSGPTAAQASIEGTADVVAAQSPEDAPEDIPEDVPEDIPAQGAEDVPEDIPAVESTTTTEAIEPSPAAGLPSVTIIGDSVVAGAADVVLQTLPNDVVIDAEVSRQFKHADEVAEGLRAEGRLGDVVILHLGTNGAFSSDTFDEVMESLEGVDRVIVCTVDVPRRWEASVNRAIWQGSERWPEVEIVDWKAIAGERSDWHFEDQVHLNGTGMRAYAETLDDVING